MVGLSVILLMEQVVTIPESSAKLKPGRSRTFLPPVTFINSVPLKPQRLQRPPQRGLSYVGDAPIGRHPRSAVTGDDDTERVALVS